MDALDDLENAFDVPSANPANPKFARNDRKGKNSAPAVEQTKVSRGLKRDASAMRGQARNVVDGGRLPWAETHAPGDSLSLAMHKKKVEEIRNALLSPLPAPLFVIRGPPGSCKSTALEVLSREVLGADVEIVEWKETPRDGFTNSNGGIGGERNEFLAHREGAMASFFKTVGVGSRYAAVIGGDDVTTRGAAAASDMSSSSSSAVSQREASKRPRVVIIDDLPPLWSGRARDDAARMSDFLLRLPSRANCHVFCLVDASRESWGCHGRVYTKAFFDSGRVRVIKVNPVARTFCTKALRQAAAAEGFPSVPAEVLEAVFDASSGDLRRAFNTLEVALLGVGRGDVLHAFRLPARKGKRGKGKGKAAAGNAAADSSSSSSSSPAGGGSKESQAIDTVVRAARSTSASLTLFHSLGKFLHAKRDSSPYVLDVDLPDEERIGLQARIGSHRLPDLFDRKGPNHGVCPVTTWEDVRLGNAQAMSMPQPRGPIKVDPERALRGCDGLSDPAHYTGFLHENVYGKFCTDLQDASDLADYFSDADLLLTCDRNAAPVSGGIAGLMSSLAVLHCRHVAGPPPGFVSLRKPGGYAADRAKREARESAVQAAANSVSANPESDASGMARWAVAGDAELFAELLPSLARVANASRRRGTGPPLSPSVSGWVAVAERANPWTYCASRVAAAEGVALEEAERLDTAMGVIMEKEESKGGMQVVQTASGQVKAAAAADDEGDEIVDDDD